MGRTVYAKPRFNAENTKGAAEIFAEQRAKPVELSRPCAPKTEEDRKRAMQAWHDFISHVARKEAVHEHVWEWLAGDDLARQNEAMALCKTFLYCLVSTSAKPKLVWGPEEQCEEQGLKTVTSVNAFWKTLVAGAQAMVLDKMAASTGRDVRLARRQGPVGANDDGPVAKITKWMMSDLRWTHNLTVDSGYDKVAATCKDIELLIKALWERADDIPMTPYNRVTVHIYLLILFFSGCRPGMLEKIMWDDVMVCLVRDPSVPSGRRLLVRLTLTFNKQDRVQIKQTERVTIDLPQMPTLLLDTTHLLAAKALYQDAFKYGYQTVDEMLNRPRLGSVATHLEWKEGLRNQRFFTMSDHTFRGLFKRLCLVAGLETPPRPYFMRVGAGANLEDAKLPLPAICHIIGHTLQVHGQNYQAGRIRHNLQAAAFGELAGSETEDLFKNLDQAWKAYDPDAPIYMTEAQKLEMEQRRDTSARREAIKALEENGGDTKEIQRLTAALNTHRKRLEELAILARREQFFRDKEASLQMGEPEKRGDRETDYYTGLAGTRSHAGIDVRSLIMVAWAPGTIFDSSAERRATVAMEWVGHYLSRNRSAISVPSAAEPLQEPSPSAGGLPALQLPAGKRSMCLVCGAAFARRADMTKHAAKHIALLSREFSCPLCNETTFSPSGFSNHVERKHGKDHAPHFVTGRTAIPAPEEAQPKDRIPCAICHCEIIGTRFLQHFNSKHAGASSYVEATLSCAACPGQQEHSLGSWFSHLADRHEVPVTEQCPFCGCLFQARGLGIHIRKAHFESSSGLVSCPLCEREGDTAAFLSDHASWLVHAQTAGHLGAQATRVSASATPFRTGSKRKAEDDPYGPGCAATQVQRPPSKVQRRDGNGDPRAPLSPEPTPEVSSSPLDLSLIDPALLGSSLSDTLFEGDDQTPFYGSSLHSIGGSTACTTPSTENPSPVVAAEKLAAAIAEMQHSAEVSAKWSQDNRGYTAATSPPCLGMGDPSLPCLNIEDTSPPCLDMEDTQPSSAAAHSPPGPEEEIVLDTIYVATTPLPHIDRPLRRSQRRTRRRVAY